MSFRRKRTFKLERPGFEYAVFTASQRFTNPANAVTSLAERDAVLQSAREAVSVLIELRGEDRSGRIQLTRTAAVYFLDGDRYHVAVDDSPDPALNLVMLYAKQGYEQQKKQKPLLIAREAEGVAAHLTRSKERTFPLPESPLELSVGDNTAFSPFSESNEVRSVLGDVSGRFGLWLFEHGQSQGAVHLYQPSQLEALTGDAVLVQPVRVYGCGLLLAHSVVTREGWGGYVRGIRNPPPFC